MSDYSLLGSFSTGGASSLNADLLTKLKDAERESVLYQIDNQLEAITGLDADTGDALDDLGESDKMTVIKTQALDLMAKMSIFDLDSTATTAFDAVSASTTGDAAVFDAIDVSGLEPGTNNITVTQLAQRDVFQSISFNGTSKDGGISVAADTVADDGDDTDPEDLALVLSSKISISMIDTDLTGKSISKSITLMDTANGAITVGSTTFTNVDSDGDGSITYADLVKQINDDGTYTASVGTDGRMIISNVPDSTTAITVTNDTLDLEFDGFNYTTYDFDIATDTTVTDMADVTVKSISTLADEINANDDLIASIETVGTDTYRLVIKSTESGQNNSLKISQTNVDLGLNDESKSSIVVPGAAKSGTITINGTTFTNDGTAGKTTYEDLRAQIDADANFSASFDSDNKLVITAIDTVNTVANGAGTGNITAIEITNDTFSLNFDATSRTQSAQNLVAEVDGIDYNVDSNTLTIQGNLTMTAVEIGDATINITKDTSAILTGVESFITSYNALVDLIDAEVADTDSPMYDISSLKSLTSDIKEKLFDNYGLNDDQNLFNYGLELDLKGHLSLDTEKFGEGLVDNYNDIKYMFLGNTTDTDLASSDSTKYMGLGTLLKTYLDDLDGTDGMITRYEASIASRKEQLEEDREDAIKSLDEKYETLSNQFSMYGSLITQMESAFSGMKMMIEQSMVSK